MTFPCVKILRQHGILPNKKEKVSLKFQESKCLACKIEFLIFILKSYFAIPGDNVIIVNN